MTDHTNSKMASCFISLAEELRAESDRGSVVLAVAWIDEQITLLLSGFLCAPLQGKEKLLKVGGPLGDFGAKIELAYRLGLIREETQRSLELFRRLRNEFAHLSSPLTFATPAVKDRVLEIFRLNQPILDGVWDSLSEVDALREFLGERSESESKVDALQRKLGARPLFDMAAAMTASGLVLAVNQVDRLEVLT